MKKRRIVLPLILGGLLASSLSFVFALSSNAKPVEAASGFSAATLPTSINLKDCTDSEIKSYYSGLTGKGSAQLQGTNLLKNLKAILSNGVDYYSYADVSKAYVITDRDWTNSPASGISGYSSSTNAISGLDYTSEVSANPYLHLLYCDYTVQSKTKYKGDGDVSTTSVSFDKEHAWSQSHGFDDGTSSGQNLTGAGSDLHHLKAGTQYGNRTLHSNYSYGFVKENDGDWSSKTYETKNKRGEPLFPHSDDQQTKVFEPQDSDKGDIARALLYLVACYNNYDGSAPTPANPALKLVNYVISGSTTGYSSTNLENGYYGILQDILAWHKIDPVDQYEIHRNNLIYRNYQHNRNPFIDYPEWVDYIWGTSTYDSSKKTITYSDSPTGYVDLNNDVINGYRSGGTVSVTGVTLDQNSVSMLDTDTIQLNETVLPVNATNKAVTWTSSKTSVATVSSTGLVTAKGVGTATITVKTADGNKTATCSVTVSSSTISVTSVSLSEDSLSLVTGDSADLVATVYPSNATNKAVTWQSSNTSVATVSNGHASAVAPGNATITVKTSDGNKTATCTVTVTDPAPQVSYSFTILPSDFYSGSYASNNGSRQSTATVVGGTGTVKVTWTRNQVRQYQSNISFQSGAGYIALEIPYAKVTNCTINNSAGTFTTAEDEDGFFRISVDSSGIGTVSSIEITYTADKVSVTGVTLDKASLTLKAGTSQILTATVLPSDASNNGLTWTSSNNNIATVSDGTVTAISEGTATITATTEDGSFSASCSLTVNPAPVYAGPVAKRVTTGLHVGDKVIIASQTSASATTCNVMKNEFKSGSSYNLESTVVSISNDAIGYTTAGTVWTVGGESGAFTFFDGTNYLYGYTYYYTNSSGTYSTYYRNVGLTSEPGELAYTWSAKANADGFSYDMMTKSDNLNVYMEWYSSEKSPDHFCGYSSINSNCPIVFYKIYSADDFANDFMDNVTCNVSGTSAPVLTKTWSQLEGLYNDIWSTSEQELLTNAEFTVTGSGSSTVVTPSEGTTQVVANAMSKYDYIVGKYGTGSYKDFISRNPSPIGNTFINPITEDSTNYFIVITVTVISMLAVTGFVIIRKRKLTK